MIPSELLVVATSLVGTIRQIIEQCEQRRQNAQLNQELHTFLQSLQEFIQQTQHKALALCNNSAVWALGALQADLESASLDASNILNKGFVRSVWDANKIQARILALRERVTTSFQTRLSVAALDVAIEGKKAQDAFQEAMLKVNKELQESCFTISASLKQEQQLALRKELRQSIQPITSALRSHSLKIEEAVSVIQSLRPQTSDAEKFFEDVLAALDGVSVQYVDDDTAARRHVPYASGSARQTGVVEWYEDPVTWEIMCDPVKASDGRTYDRWTMLGEYGHMAASPFRPDDPRPFHIAADDIDVRSRLFQEFPEQESQFRGKRSAYRDTALHEVQLGHFAESASMLRHVLEWAHDDVECREKLEYVQCRIRVARGKSILSADEVEQSWQDAAIRLDDASSSATLLQPRYLYSSRLDSSRSNTDVLLLGPDGLSCRYNRSAEGSDDVGAAIADMAVPEFDGLERSSAVFYFEISVEELDWSNVVGLGFTGSNSFCNNLLPGCYLNSCGYHFGDHGRHFGDHGRIFADGLQVEEGEVTRYIARQGDKWGAGIHHGHNEIFFVYNGSVIAAITNTISGAVMPVVALGRSPRANVKVAFESAAIFRPEQALSRLVISDPENQRTRVSLSPDGLMAEFVGKPKTLEYACLRANYSARFQHPSQSFYFELTVVEQGERDVVAIGFAHRNFFQSSCLPGWYRNSCAYHGNDGSLFFGNKELPQRDFGPPFSKGDTIGAGIDHASSTIFFVRNGKAVGYTRRVRMSCALCPVIGLQSSKQQVFLKDVFIGSHSRKQAVSLKAWYRGSHSTKQRVSLNFGQAPFSIHTYNMNSIAPDLDTIIEQPTRLVWGHVLNDEWVSLSKDGLTAEFCKTEGLMVALAADHALLRAFRHSRLVFYFELTIVRIQDEFGCNGIWIGFGNQDNFNFYTPPGRSQNSCGYDGCTGSLWLCGSIVNKVTLPSMDGDVMGAGVDFSTNTIFFARCGEVVGHVKLDMPHALLPIITVGHKEKVRLNFGQAPFLLSNEAIGILKCSLK